MFSIMACSLIVNRPLDGNFFQDLGRLRPAEALAKAELARNIAALIAERRLTGGSSSS
jgi:hypothetical protein